MWLGDRNRWYSRGDKLVVSHDGGAVVLAGWPRCLAWRRDAGQAWRPFRPAEAVLRVVVSVASPGYVERAMRRFGEHWHPSAVLPSAHPALVGDAIGGSIEVLRAQSERRERHLHGITRRHEAARTFLATFPGDTVPAVSPLFERDWPVLALLTRCPGAGELFGQNPALAFALASSWAFRERPVQRPLRSARALLRKRRVAVAEWLDFPASPAAVRVLSKLPVRAVTVRQLRYLRETLRADPLPKALLHLPRLDTGVLRVLTDPELCTLASFSLLAEIAQDEPRSTRDAYRLRDAARMHTALRGGRRLPVQRSLARLRAVHDELTEQMNRHTLLDQLDVQLPPPPVRGTDTIVPLTTPGDVLEEGRAMHHCVFSYLADVARGATYMYRVLEPERATVSLVRRGALWEVGQIAGIANAKVQAGTVAAIDGWLSELAWRCRSCDESAA